MSESAKSSAATPTGAGLSDDRKKWIAEVCGGDKRAVARLFNLLEDRRADRVAEAAAILDELFDAGLTRGHAIGITGPPGVGKSSLLSQLIKTVRGRGKSVGVIAVDPSSQSTSGALLGDRVRLDLGTSDEGVYVRSMASGGDSGGLSGHAFAGIVALRSAFDLTLVETVGIGQSESDITRLVDTTMFVIQPGSGDMIQYVKSGIMEEPNLFVVNKADLKEQALRTLNDVKAALAHRQIGDDAWSPRALLCSASENRGVADILDEAQAHFEYAQKGEPLARIRRVQAAHWVRQSSVRLYGSRGAALSGDMEEIAGRLEADPSAGPFALLGRFSAEMEAKLA